MKTILNLLSLAMLPLLSACGVTQELKEGVSFANLNRIYVEMPSNSMQNMSYYMNPAEINSVVASDIAEFLKERGYQIVANKADAQIVFVPIWNFSLKDPMTNNPFYNGTTESMMVFNGYYMQNSQYYATLEIQAYLPSREDWVWRGFSRFFRCFRHPAGGRFFRLPWSEPPGYGCRTGLNPPDVRGRHAELSS